MTEPSVSVKISEATFKRLQSLAEPLVDDIDSVISKILDAVDIVRLQNAGPMQISPFSPPPLTHTRVIGAMINGKGLNSPTWNGLVVAIIQQLGVSARRLSEQGFLNCVDGQKDDEGYRHYPELNMSIQGMAADRAFRSAFAIARQYGLDLAVEFEWRDRTDAAHPGVRAVAVYDPPSDPGLSRRPL